MTELVSLSEAKTIKWGNGFCVSLEDGRLPAADDHPLGVYLDDCRYLRAHELRIGGELPRLLIASDASGTAAVFEHTNPELTLASGQRLPLQSLRVRVERRMLSEAMRDRITLHSYVREPIELEVELRFDADFRPMLEVRGVVNPSVRQVRRQVRGDTLTFTATGLDGNERSTVIRCAGAVAEEGGRLFARVKLDPGEERTLDVDFALGRPDRGARMAVKGNGRHQPDADGHPGAQADAWLADHPRFEIDDRLVDRTVRRSLLDIRLLASDLDGQRYCSAGVPWYATLFGRDSIITALQLLAFDPGMAEQTLRVLAARLGSVFDDEHDEEPGKVLHELRVGEVAEAGLTPLARYYGTVDATPLFLCLLCAHADWTGSLTLFRELRSEVDAALRWIDEFGDLDGDGLLDYRKRSSAGLDNQGWKDSWDGILDERGDPVAPPIALVEAQGYALAAKRRLARLFELDGDHERAAQLAAQSARVGEELEAFWLPGRGYYSMALDADKRPSQAQASNQGHLLWARAVAPDRSKAIRDSLLGPGMYSGWGIRTLSSTEPAFNPVGYHTGTVWPHDNALTAVGLRSYGLDQEFLRIFEDMLDAASHFPDLRLPELFAGFSRSSYEDPVPYPVACQPQAWAAASIPALLTAGLGLIPDAFEQTLRILPPCLPAQVSSVAVRGLRVGDSSVDLSFERNQRTGAVALAEADAEGDLEVVLEIPPGQGQRRPAGVAGQSSN